MRRPTRSRTTLAAAALALAAGGCGIMRGPGATPDPAEPRAAEPIAEAPPEAAAAEPRPDDEATSLAVRDLQPSRVDPGETLPPEINDVRSATKLVALMPPLADPLTRQEVTLHAALYRAARADAVGGRTGHFVLEPWRDWVMDRLAIPPRDFRLRVLSELADLDVPLAWADARDPDEADPGPDLFPGTPVLATRLTVRILRRDLEHATVRAEIGDRTWRGRSSRRLVRAVWDGEGWQVRHAGARTIW